MSKTNATHFAVSRVRKSAQGVLCIIKAAHVAVNRLCV